MRNVSDESDRENKNTILCSITFLIELFRGKVAKYCRSGQATDDNMVPEHFTLPT